MGELALFYLTLVVAPLPLSVHSLDRSTALFYLTPLNIVLLDTVAVAVVIATKDTLGCFLELKMLPAICFFLLQKRLRQLFLVKEDTKCDHGLIIK